MRLFFGKRKEEPEQQPQLDLPSAILKNKEAISTLEKRYIHIEKKILSQETEARARVQAKDKRGAMMALRRKKMYEEELENLENTRLTLEQQIITLESAQTQQVAVGALATGVVTQKKLNQQMNLGKIDNLMEDIQDQADQHKEISQVLQQGAPIMDDDDLIAELEALEATELDKRLASASSVPSEPLPNGIASVPTVSGSIQENVVERHNMQGQQTTVQLSDEDQLKALMGELV